MIEQHQTIFGTPFGNCFSTCVACIFDVSVEEMQNFMLSGDDEWWEVFQLWCRERGYTPLMFEGVDEETMKQIPDVLCIVSGPADRGLDHSVIWKSGAVVWDPHPSETGINKVKDVVVFIKNDPGKEQDDAVSTLRRSSAAADNGSDPCPPPLGTLAQEAPPPPPQQEGVLRHRRLRWSQDEDEASPSSPTRKNDVTNTYAQQDAAARAGAGVEPPQAPYDLTTLPLELNRVQEVGMEAPDSISEEEVPFRLEIPFRLIKDDDP